MSHAPIAPSSLDLTVKCHASVQLQAQVPALPDTEEEAEGKAAHWVALRYAAGYGRTELPLNAKFTFENRTWTVDMDMLAGATMYAHAAGGTHNDLRLEDPVKVKRVHSEHCWGTPDAWRFFPDARKAHEVCPFEIPTILFHAGQIKILRVPEYKYGHRYVESFGNLQIAAYASGVMDRLNLDDLDPSLWVEMVIVQPRSFKAEGPIRWWRIQASALRPWINRASNAAHAALAPNPVATTNDSCIDCRARHACATLQYATGALIDFSAQGELVEMPHDAIGTELAMVQDAIKRLEARETGLAAQAEAIIRQGKPVSFFHMEAGQSRLTYFENASVDELLGFGDLVGVDLRRPLTKKDLLVTPTQAIQLGIDAVTMKHYADRPKAALKLARDNSITARKVFAK